MLVAGSNRMTFTNASFHNCCLVVDQGASVSCVDTSFSMHGSNSKSVSIVVRGEGSRVTLNRCRIDGGLQSADISLGASLHANQLTCTGTRLGFQVSDASSRLELRNSTITGTSSAGRFLSGMLTGSQNSGASVLASSRSHCHIEGCTISSGGVHANDACLQLHNSRVSNCQHSCCTLTACIGAQIENCVFEESSNTGLIVSGGAGVCEVRDCSFVGHVSCGVVASSNAQVELHACRTESNGIGYKACYGSRVVATDCRSLLDYTGFCADGTGSTLCVANGTVQNCKNVGVIVSEGEAELQDSTIQGPHGMYAVFAKVSVRRCAFIASDSDALIKTGVAVMEGTSLVAEEMICSGFAWVGVHVQGDGSNAELSRCEMRYSSGAVCSRNGAACTLNECKLGGWMQSCHVVGVGSSLILHSSSLEVCRPQCDVGECLTVGSAAACGGAHMELHDCELRSEGQHGVVGMDEGTSVLMTGGAIEGGTDAGVSAVESAVVVMQRVNVTSRGVSFVSASRGQLHLSECVCHEGKPYCSEAGGEIFCNECVPKDKSLESLALNPGSFFS